MIRIALSAVLLLICLLVLLLLFTLLPVTYADWIDYLRPAALNWRQPYRPGVFNPPWLFLILHPLALPPARIGVALLLTLTLLTVTLYVRRPWKVFLIGISAPMVALVTVAQIDVLSVLGLAIPAGLGLPLLMIKPQGVFLATLRRINRCSILVTLIVVIVSVPVWGPWWQHSLKGNEVVGSDHNVSLFPYSVPFGVIFLYLGLRRRSDGLLCLASLCFSPYYQMTSTLPAVAALIKESTDKRWIALAFVGPWLYFLLTPH